MGIKHIIIGGIFAASVLLLGSKELVGVGGKSLPVTESQSSEENVPQGNEMDHDRIEQFLDGFSQTYPNFEILEYVVGSAQTSPIELVAIAKNKNDHSSSTLFIVDHNGVGQVVLASDRFAVYREKDKLVLNQNVISVSLDLSITETNTEIHDYKITVTQEEKQGGWNTIYSSKEETRTKK